MCRRGDLEDNCPKFRSLWKLFHHLLSHGGLACYRQLGLDLVLLERQLHRRQRVEKGHPVDRVAPLEGAFTAGCDSLFLWCRVRNGRGGAWSRRSRRTANALVPTVCIEKLQQAFKENPHYRLCSNTT